MDKRKVSELIPYANNSRTHSDEQITKIASSIKEFGFLNPVIIDSENGIIAGHGRVMAAKKLGIDEVPVVDASYLTEAQKKAYIIADNRLALDAGWDDEILRVELEALKELDFNIELTGFNTDEIENLFIEQYEIEEVDHFNETFNVSIRCDDLTQMALLQDMLDINGKKIDAKKLINKLNDNENSNIRR